jgi:hypothetical protein
MNINMNYMQGQTAARWISAFILLAFLAYGIGSSLMSGTTNTTQVFGALLVATNSLMVISIGVLFVGILKPYSTKIAFTYLVSRALEGLFLASTIIPAILWTDFSITPDTFYCLGMLLLGLGSLPLCILFYKASLTPAWMAIWGFVGYALIALGFTLGLFQIVEMSSTMGILFLAIGGVWEVVFGVWMFLKLVR